MTRRRATHAALAVAALLGGLYLARPTRPAYLPDPKLTPGAIVPGVGRDQTCDPGYARRARDVPDSVKVGVFLRYGIQPTAANRARYEIDHLIPLSVGGSNSVDNLWAQPWDGPTGAHVKDRLEAWLYRAVCRGELTIGQAQDAIRGDWTIAARKYLPAPKATMNGLPGPDEPDHDAEGLPVQN